MKISVPYSYDKRNITSTSYLLQNKKTGHSKLIPSLTEKKPSLNSLLPILSEFVHPANTKNTNVNATDAVSQKSSPVHNEQSLPAMVPRHHAKSNKPKMALPSTKTQTEPISLELFICAAVDLDRKGEIELDRYKKYLCNQD